MHSLGIYFTTMALTVDGRTHGWVLDANSMAVRRQRPFSSSTPVCPSPLSLSASVSAESPFPDVFQDVPRGKSSPIKKIITNQKKTGPLSLTLEELSQVLGGKGRAQACWDCFRLGMDPLWFYHSSEEEAEDSVDMETKEPLDEVLATFLSTEYSTLPQIGWTRAQLQEQITPRRQTQTLGHKTLYKYQREFFPRQSTSTCTDTTTHDSSNSMSSIAKIVQVHQSQDGTTKLLLELAKDKLQVECVILPWSDRKTSTLCVSNQVGCGQGCTFCSTGRMGEWRSLTADEILVQVYYAAKVCRLLSSSSLSHDNNNSKNVLYPLDAIVFMGMGEAARNVDNVVLATKALVDPHMYQLAPKRITVSTVGPTPVSFSELSQAPAVLAWSVHASQDDVRKRLVPTTKHSMVELRDALIAALVQRPKRMRQVMLELALVGDINDRIEDAEHLVEFCQAFYEKVPGVKLVVNLIPWNDIAATSGPAANYQKPTTERVLAFQKVMVENNILCYCRTTRGDDESAACGQLATMAKKAKESAANDDGIM